MLYFHIKIHKQTDHWDIDCKAVITYMDLTADKQGPGSIKGCTLQRMRLLPRLPRERCNTSAHFTMCPLVLTLHQRQHPPLAARVWKKQASKQRSSKAFPSCIQQLFGQLQQQLLSSLTAFCTGLCHAKAYVLLSNQGSYISKKPLRSNINYDDNNDLSSRTVAFDY